MFSIKVSSLQVRNRSSPTSVAILSSFFRAIADSQKSDRLLANQLIDKVLGFARLYRRQFAIVAPKLFFISAVEF
ncbi:MAG: hypothetical protein QNJ70_26630 [Xenococcaceae cyanobacterium MO_207.B15]|nr:hypothetical protein [Xenococcaceae cyanobacterium MO_207.B15]